MSGAPDSGRPAGGSVITVAGIGADGWGGLSEPARAAILAATEIYGSVRQLELLPAAASQNRHPWPTPLAPALDVLIARATGAGCAADLPGADEANVVILASGDPMLHGIGVTLARRLGSEALAGGRLSVIPHPSAFALVCARLGWPEHETVLLSAVSAPVDILARALTPGRRIVLYGSGTDLGTRAADALTVRGYGASTLTLLERLGAGDEHITTSTAATWNPAENDPLSTIAIAAVPDPGTPLLSATPGLPDDAYDHDGALTKRHIRAVTLAALAPAAGQRLWDIGSGSGSIAIEWLRAEPTATAVAVESRSDRAHRIAANAATLGVPERLTLVEGTAPAALTGLPRPDAIFIGGGLTGGVLDVALTALNPGGRLVANAVTIEGEQLLTAAHAAHGGELAKLEISHAEPLGSYRAWRPALPIVQWEYTQP